MMRNGGTSTHMPAAIKRVLRDLWASEAHEQRRWTSQHFRSWKGKLCSTAALYCRRAWQLLELLQLLQSV